jgi:hypothetical protein
MQKKMMMGILYNIFGAMREQFLNFLHEKPLNHAGLWFYALPIRRGGAIIILVRQTPLVLFCAGAAG